MTVTTQQSYVGHTVVRVETKCNDKIMFCFSTRHDAAVFLNALRKRIRR